MSEALARLDSEDTSVVVFGSLARDEFTNSSDVDWTLLLDGSADPKHLELAGTVKDEVNRLALKPPGREGAFGNLVFSHDLIHKIGGQDDTNRNTTQRILLLLESRAVGRHEAYDRVTANILKRYILEDRGFVRGSASFHVPRFLLNDFARYWRTMAVDFAYKQRTRFGEGAAIRNLKLRMSRKVIYVSGLLACFGCHINLGGDRPSNACSIGERAPECVECLCKSLSRTPLEILADALLQFDHLSETAIKLFDAYDGFVGILSDERRRAQLEEFEDEGYEDNEVYQEARDLTHKFRDGLLDLFFDTKSGLYELTRNYGVF